MIEALDYKFTDCLDQKMITFRKYHFRFIDFFNMSYFRKINNNKFKLESAAIMAKVYHNIHSHNYITLQRGKTEWSMTELR